MSACVDAALARRRRDLGYALFERAREAEPGWMQRAWWDQRLLDYFIAQPVLQTQLFRFLETVPYLRDDADRADHLKQYLAPLGEDLPLAFRFLLLFERPDSLWGRSVGSAVRTGALLMGRRFMTGTCTAEAIAYAAALRAEGMTFTLDVLGEATISERQADEAADVYRTLIEALGRAAKSWRHQPLLDEGRHGLMPRANISIKLSALDPVFNPVDPAGIQQAMDRRLKPLLRHARRCGVFVNIDMEQFRYRDVTFAVFRRLLDADDLRDWPDVGIVVQAYLRDAEDDLHALLDWVRQRGTPIAVRLVKGAYWDTETTHAVRNHVAVPVWTQKWQSDASFEKLTRIMLASADLIRPAFASHNVRSLAHAVATAEHLGLTARDYELQMLAGMGDPLKSAAVALGQCVRVYCPYGDLLRGMAYLIRRLLENTSNDSFLRQGFSARGTYDDLLADPALTLPASAALPGFHYQDTSEEPPMSTDTHGLDFQNAASTSFASAAHRARFADILDAARADCPSTHPLRIDGTDCETGDWIASHNPARPHDIIGRVARASEAEADRAVAAAHRAFTAWSAEPGAQRSACLRRLAQQLETQRFPLASALVLEIGKTPPQADAEITEAIDYCHYHAALVERQAAHPRRRNVPGEDNELVYDPYGVCVLIGSWDFPVALMTGMLSAALATGNTAVIKPSCKAAVVSARLFGLLEDAGLPSGVANFLPGEGTTVGRHLVNHPGVHLVALFGAREPALETLAATAQVRPGQQHMKRAIINSGAKNAIIVDHDVDIDEAVQGVLESAFSFSGQKCTACSRVIVHDAIHDRFCDRLAEAASALRIGDPEDPAVMISPVISDEHRQRITAIIEKARQDTRVLFQADPTQLPRHGHFVPPTVFADVDPNAPLAREEIFGPVLAVLRARDFDHALALANDSMYALTGGVYSRSPRHIRQACRAFRVGNLYINRRITGSQVDIQPYGGGRLSGDGARLGGPDYLLQYCMPRTISENTLRHGLTAGDTAVDAAATMA